jgi:hypothetical protein
VTSQYYLVESASPSVSHGGRESEGVPMRSGKEKIYLHVLPLTDSEVGKLRARLDEHGNADHSRFGVRGQDDWWIAAEGEAAWPGITRPRLTSRLSEALTALPLTPQELDLLRGAGLKGV